jgi:glycosyltransferase involved in cell wall biosynthesis
MPVPRYWLAPAPESWFHSAAFEEALAPAYKSGDYDLVHIDELLLIRPLCELSGPPEILHHHKLDVELCRGLHLAGRASLVETMRWRGLEELAAARFCEHIFCSDHDATEFRERHPGAATHIVPNGVDLEYFKPRDEPRDRNELLVLGSLDYEPNLQGLEVFLDSVWPKIQGRRPELSLVVVGARAASGFLSRPPAGVHLVGEVPDVRPYLARAGALLVPLDIGGGSRLKIAEALAMGCPVISTEIGAQGLKGDFGPLLARASSITDLAELLLDWTRPPSQGARAASVTNLAWSHAADELHAAWTAVATPPQA